MILYCTLSHWSVWWNTKSCMTTCTYQHDNVHIPAWQHALVCRTTYTYLHDIMHLPAKLHALICIVTCICLHGNMHLPTWHYALICLAGYSPLTCIGNTDWPAWDGPACQGPDFLHLLGRQDVTVGYNRNSGLLGHGHYIELFFICVKGVIRNKYTEWNNLTVFLASSWGRVNS
jgi:hypothetical protein